MEEMSDDPRGHANCLRFIKSRTVHFGGANCRYIRLRSGLVYSKRLTTGIRSEKCVVRRFRRCVNVIQCTYTNLDITV